MKVMAFTIRQRICSSVATACGALFAVAFSRKFAEAADGTLGVVVIVSFFLMFGVTAALGRFDTPVVFIGPFLVIGISVGIVANTVYDWQVHREDHNLFPIEIVALTVLATPGVIAGAGLTWLLRRP